MTWEKHGLKSMSTPCKKRSWNRRLLAKSAMSSIRGCNLQDGKLRAARSWRVLYDLLDNFGPAP